MKRVLTLLAISIIFWSCNQETKKETKNVENQQETKKEVAPDFDRKVYMMKGKMLAQSTFKVFKGKIQAVGQNKGLPGVVDFCHDKAMHLSDSIGKAHHVVIKRTSHKLRNEKNAPDDEQKMVIDNYLRLQEDPNKPMEPIVMKDSEGFVHFYAPIKLKKECLQCHGVPEKEIKEPVLKEIKKFYPGDKATGFREGELRGIWDIKFLEKPE